MVILFPTLAVAALVAYYFLIFKPNQDAKISTKIKGTSEVVAPVDHYAEIIDDYPTLFTQDGVK